MPVMCLNHFCRVRVTSLLSQSRIVGLQGQVNVKSNEISRFSYVFFCYEIAPCKLVNGAPYATKWRR